MAFQIAIKNLSTVVSDLDVQACVAALQIQVTRDFQTAWGVNAHLRVAAKSEVLLAGEWLLGIYDDANQAGALGYHDVTAAGAPLGKVFAKTTIDDGGLWTVTTSHELLEMLADPWIQTCSLDDSSMRLYATEVCDACEADELGYAIDGVQVSDFVLPNFFEPNASVPAGIKRSWCGNLSRSFEIAPGGYLSWLDLRNVGAGWQQDMARRVGTSRAARRVAVFAGQTRKASVAP